MDLKDTEYSLLGTFMDKPDLFDECDNLVFKHIFSPGVCRSSYDIIKQSHSKKSSIDHTILMSELKKLGYNSTSLAEALKMTFDYKTSSDPKPKVQILFDNYVQANMAPLLHEAAVEFKTGNADTWNVISKLRNKITDIDGVVNNVQKTVTIADVYEESLKEIEDLMNDKKSAGYPTGLTEHDAKTGGITQGVTVIGAPPGAGKSSLVVSIIKNNAVDNNVPVIFFSIEMPAKQVMINLLANMFSINSFALRTGQINESDYDKIKNAKNKFKNNLIIDDTPGINWKYVDNQFRKLRKTIPMSTTIIGIIDYLQIMGLADGEYMMSQESQMSTRCRELQTSAKRWNVALIQLSQLSREVGKRSPPRPMLSDLKESGAIEANAQQVWLLYRPDYYDVNPTDENGNSLKGLCEINRAKNRYGSTGATYVRFEKQYSQFLDREPEPSF